MTFKLALSTTDKRRSIFHITNAAGSVVGSVHVKPEEADDLRKCWRDSAPAVRNAAARQARVVNAMVAAMKKSSPRLNKEAILRGC